MTTPNQPCPADRAAKSRSPAGIGADPKWWTLAAVYLGTFMLLLDITIVNVALPAIQDRWARRSRTCNGSSTLTPSPSRRCC